MTTNDQRPLRILHLVATYRWSGVAEPATSVALHHLKAGCGVEMTVFWNGPFEERLKRVGVPTARGLRIERTLNPWGQLREIRKLRAYLEENRVDIVHCHLIHDHWMAAVALRGMKGRRPLLVRTVHRFEPMRRDPMNRALFERMTDMVITVSSAQEELIRAAYPAIGNRVRVIHGGVDPSRFRPDLPGVAEMRKELGAGPDTVVAGIVAHLGFNRGHRWLMRSVQVALDRIPNAAVWIVGDGEIRDELRNEAALPRYRRQVVMAGYRKGDLPVVYAAMDVGMLLGLGSEGSARAALETMSSGRPLIGVRRGALLDTVTEGHDGFLVPENDTEALASALVTLLNDRARIREMGANARSTVLTRFTETLRAENTLAAYHEILAAVSGRA